MPNTIQRTIQFYWLRSRNRNNTSILQEVGFTTEKWNSIFSSLHNMPLNERTIGDTAYDGIKHEKFPVLVVYEQFSSDFLQIVDRANQSIIDYADSSKAEETLAKSSAYAFFPEFDLIGRVSGSGNKGVKSLERFLNKTNSNIDTLFEVIPVVTIDSIERFEKELQGLKSASLAFDTTRFLDPEENIQGNAVEFFTSIANKLGVDLHIDINMSIKRIHKNKNHLSFFKKLLSPSIESSAKQRTKAQVSGFDYADKLIELNLVEHPVIEQSEISLPPNEPFKLSRLIEHLRKTCEIKEDELYEISKKN